MKSWEEKSWVSRKLYSRAPIDPLEHAGVLASRLEILGDAFLRAEKGSTAKKVSSNLAVVLAANATVPTALLGIASFFGTAGTGTAISSLSGAAFNSAALAWLGGSVFTGTIIVAATTVAAAWAGKAAIKKFSERFKDERKIEELSSREKTIYDAIVEIAFRLKQGSMVSGPTLLSFWNLNISPMLDQIERLTIDSYQKWNPKRLKKLELALLKLRQLEKKTDRRLSKTAHVPISIFSATVTKLYLEIGKWNEVDHLVMDAFRRSTNSLSDSASPEEIGAYIRGIDNPEARQGMLNNVKGIYHELAFAHRENNDGDEWFVELSVETNEPGVDVWLVNESTGERIPYQLKASDSASSASNHYEKYDTQVIGTDEIVNEPGGVQGSGFSNAELTGQTEATTAKLEAEGTVSQLLGESLLAASVAGAISFSITLGVKLKSGESAYGSVNQSIASAKKAFLTGGLIASVTELII